MNMNKYRVKCCFCHTYKYVNRKPLCLNESCEDCYYRVTKRLAWIKEHDMLNDTTMVDFHIDRGVVVINLE